MKLLNTTQVKKKQHLQEQKKIIKSKKIDEYVNKEIENLNKFKTEHKEQMEKVQGDFIQYFEEVQKERRELDKDLKKLQEKKETLMVPLKELENKLNKREKELVMRESEVSRLLEEIEESEKFIDREKKRLANKNKSLHELEERYMDELRDEQIDRENLEMEKRRFEKERIDWAEYMKDMKHIITTEQEKGRDMQQRAQAKEIYLAGKEKSIKKKMEWIEAKQARLKILIKKYGN